MNGFKIKTNNGITIRFRYYTEAPVTAKAFDEALPFSLTIMHAKVSGQELWSDKAPALDIIQENASVFAEPWRICYCPYETGRNKVKNCLGIFYGEGKLVDCCNFFAKVYDEDIALLQELGNKIWQEGFQQIDFEKIS